VHHIAEKGYFPLDTLIQDSVGLLEKDASYNADLPQFLTGVLGGLCLRFFGGLIKRTSVGWF
jgi:hypothetical protein